MRFIRLILTISILILSVEASNSQDLPLLKVSKDRCFIVTQDNEPFFWLGDTAWELIHRLNKNEVDQYLFDRAKKGFTVIQTVILAELDGLNTKNAYGATPLLDNDPTKLNEAYFTHVDYVIEKANELGLYIAILPAWGDKFNKKWGAGPEIFNPDNAAIYGQLLAKRYLNYNNLIWILGGDRAIENETHAQIIKKMAHGIREVDSKHLITFHPVGGKKATDYFNESWLDLDMYQSGHSRTAREYSFVIYSRNIAPKRPIINGEARYENIPDRFWENNDYGWLDDADVRISAYWSFLAGAAGYTYGCNDIWQMYDINKTPILEARTDWQIALQLPGSIQMGYLRQIFEKLPWQSMIPNQSLILNENIEDESYILCSATKDHKTLIAYTPLGIPIEIDLPKLNAENIEAYWFNPRSGKKKHLGSYKTSLPHKFEPWSHGWGSDFLLILTAVKL
ncbi:glycoside hydrolase family 140 protein [Carboxylicivirga sp. A043]|uniref:glycoside hydrolase family 140 protein n=1 Tax=Carboxylicivirga litoralis TaxID=2816963 RepID=UPI0021CAE4FB|nr:glycoside hydrolase family 140 protein [Carboxylicivirga sp. A043]MCU4157880.1 glycoside hydrolase family 140 protein [Carboxylicivirga sp. A043]